MTKSVTIRTLSISWVFRVTVPNIAGINNPGCALNAFCAVLEGYGYHLDNPRCSGEHGSEEFEVLEGHGDTGRCVGRAVIIWHLRSSGNYEFVGYVKQ